MQIVNSVRQLAYIFLLILSLFFIGTRAGNAMPQTKAKAGAGDGTEKDVKFVTKDGWTIYGSLRMPSGLERGAPALILLHEAGHDRSDYELINPTSGNTHAIGFADAAESAGFAVLTMDWRGRGQSMGKGEPIEDELNSFSIKARAQMYQDVTAAIDFLAAQPGIDHNRIGLVASGFAVDPAVRAIRESMMPIRTLVLLSGFGLSQESKEFLQTSNIPTYGLVSIDDKEAFKDLAEVYSASSNPASRLVTVEGGGRGVRLMLDEYLHEPPKSTPYRQEVMMNWLVTQVELLGKSEAVSFKTEDGFTINGTFRRPDSLGKGDKLFPAVVMIGGGRTDRFALYKFEEDVARRGFAVLTIELRGRGNSRGGNSISSAEGKAMFTGLDKARIDLDAQAAVTYLQAQKGIDKNHIGLLAEAIGTKAAVLAAANNPAVTSMVLISAYGSDDPQVRQFLSTTKIPILFIDAEKNWNTRPATESAAKITKSGRLVIYPGIGQGHHMPDSHPEVVDLSGTWLQQTVKGNQ
jgi:dienelactone hydrolase